VGFAITKKAGKVSTICYQICYQSKKMDEKKPPEKSGGFGYCGGAGSMPLELCYFIIIGINGD
jgi:hypothetical protein